MGFWRDNWLKYMLREALMLIYSNNGRSVSRTLRAVYRSNPAPIHIRKNTGVFGFMLRIIY